MCIGTILALEYPYRFFYRGTRVSSLGPSKKKYKSSSHHLTSITTTSQKALYAPSKTISLQEYAQNTLTSP